MIRRVVLFASLVVVVLATLARPAFAMPAGFCDDRGASAIAPPPTLEAPDIAIRQARVPAVCEGSRLSACETAGPAHRSPAVQGASFEPVSTSATKLHIAPAGSQLERSVPERRHGVSGTRWRVERPPRG